MPNQTHDDSHPSLAQPPTPSRAPTHRVAVVSASVRAQRVNPAVTDWVTDTIEHLGGFQVDPIDLAHTNLPDDSQLHPGGEPKTEVARRIDAAEAFVFVTPEYNSSYPAALKRLIDWHYTEWQLKPVLLIGYGLHGGGQVPGSGVALCSFAEG